MTKAIAIGACVTALAGLSAYSVGWANGPDTPSSSSSSVRPSVEASQSAQRDEVSLDLSELLRPGTVLEPSERARSLSGKRVRVTGHMAEMEEPLEGAFYLVPRALRCDEGGGGTGDLPPHSILVSVTSLPHAKVPFVRGPLEAVGVFEVGNRADEAGRVSAFRLHLAGAPNAVALR